MVSIPKVDAVGPKAVNAILFLPISEHLAVPLTRQLSRQAQTRAGTRQTMPGTATKLPHMTGGSRVQPPPLPRLPGIDPAGRLPHVAFVSSDFGQTVMLSFLMSPFSLPVMQMGFEPYLRLIFEEQELFERLMRVNSAFCVAWANAQLDAGANAKSDLEFHILDQLCDLGGGGPHP